MPPEPPFDILRAHQAHQTLGSGVAACALPGALPKAPIRIEHTDTDGTTLFNERFPVADAAMKIKELLKDEKPDVRRRVLEQMQRKVDGQIEEKEALRRDHLTRLEQIEKERQDLEAFQAATIELMRWQKAGLRMERPRGSVMHHLLDAMAEKRVRLLFAEAAGLPGDFKTGHLVGRGTHAFLVEHDWAGVFESATDFAGHDFQLPYDSMCFEFRISGKNICAMITHNDSRKLLAPFVETDYGWVIPKYAYQQTGAEAWQPTTSRATPGNDEFEPLRALICGQIRAACISLEAQVTKTEIVRASHRLNRSREKRGRASIADYHVIKLAHRYRALPRPDAGDGELWARKRLHFRRGHDRHYETYKIWIKWMLVGDPDLGFVDKHYRL